MDEGKVDIYKKVEKAIAKENDQYQLSPRDFLSLARGAFAIWFL